MLTKQKNFGYQKSLIILVVIIASMLTIGSALADYNLQKEQFIKMRPDSRSRPKNRLKERIENRISRRLISGKVVGRFDNWLILDDQSGQSWMVSLDQITRYRKNGQEITKDDILSGDMITVFGRTDIQAKSIQAILVRKLN